MKKTILTLLGGAVLGAAIMFLFTRNNVDKCQRYYDSYKIKFAEALATDSDTTKELLQEFQDNMPEGCEDYAQ